MILTSETTNVTVYKKSGHAHFQFLYFQKDNHPEEVFSTQVDEETLAAAQQRQAEQTQQGTLFKTEEWGPSRPPSVSLNQVVNNKVNEQ